MNTYHKIQIMRDFNPQDPRGWDNLGTMCCWHSRYRLGDKNGPKLLLDDIRSDKNYKEDWEDYGSDDFRDLTDPRQLIETAKELSFMILPLYLYDHSGITMNTTGFSCGWDSGQVGIIYTTDKKILENYMRTESPERYYERAKEMLTWEVETYDQFLTGNVWGFNIYEVMTPDDQLSDNGWYGELIRDIESCWGFYGDDPKTNGMQDEWPDEYRNVEPEFIYE